MAVTIFYKTTDGIHIGSKSDGDKGLQLEHIHYFSIGKYCDSIAQVWRLDSGHCLLRTLRYVIRGLRHPVGSIKWASTLMQAPVLRQWFSTNPRLLLKPSRHYISRCHSFRARVQIICNHYTALPRLLSPAAIRTLSQGHHLPLATLTGKKGGEFRVSLQRTDKFDREGELALVLQESHHNQNIFHLIFSLNSINGRSRMEIGCMQGPRCAHGKELLKQTTKELHGIRPRNLMIDVAYAISAAWGIVDRYGVCNQSRIYNGKDTHADYDTLWLEIGATRDRDGMFRLPASQHHHPLEEIPSHHRAEYRRRIALRAELKEKILAGAQALRPEGSPGINARTTANPCLF